jgi:hypothetical protein
MTSGHLDITGLNLAGARSRLSGWALGALLLASWLFLASAAPGAALLARIANAEAAQDMSLPVARLHVSAAAVSRMQALPDRHSNGADAVVTAEETALSTLPKDRGNPSRPTTSPARSGDIARARAPPDLQA